LSTPSTLQSEGVGLPNQVLFRLDKNIFVLAKNEV